MKAVLYSFARNNLKSIINNICDNFEEYIITTKDNKTAVLISYEEYSSLKETKYLLSTNNNSKRLEQSVEQIEKLEFMKKDITL